MSTKTTLKRIALVAVSALGLGVLSLAPASAVAGAIQSVTMGAATPARPGVATTGVVNIKYASASAIDNNDTVTVAARVLTAPTGSAMTGVSVASNASGAVLAFSALASGYTDSEANDAYTAYAAGGISSVQTTSRFDATAAVDTDAASSLSVALSFIPDVAGTYTILVSGGNTTFTTGDKSAIWTVTTVGAPAAVSLSSINSTVATTHTTGARIKVVLTDASGNPTVLSATENLAITTSSANTTQTATSLGNSDFATLGYALFYSKDSDGAGTTGYTEVVSVAGSGTLSAAVNSNITITYRAVETAVNDIDLAFSSTAASSSAATTPAGYEWVSADTAYNVSTAQTSHSFYIASTASSTAAKYYAVTVTDTDGAISGVAATTINLIATQAAASTSSFATLSLSAALANGKAFSIAHGTDSVTFTGETPALDAYDIETPAQRAAVGATVTVKGIAYDQFGIEIANAPISVSVAGRNTVAAKTFVSDADGYVTFTYTDAGTASTVATVDTVSFGSDDSVTITFGAYTVGTVTVTGGATADTVAYPAVGSTTAAISTGATGAGAATTTFTATVKDASGNLLSGIPVTWTVDKATAGITKSLTSDASVCITGSAGTCTTTVYSWAAPSKVTVTATAGGKSGTGYQNFVNAATDARVLSATVSGNIVTAKVVDRYGNAVASVTVTGTTSAGYFGSGVTSATGTTGTDGTVGFVLLGNSGDASVTVKVDSATYTQTDDAAGKVGTTTVTAAVAGTSTGVGASLAPAGVNSVSVSVAGGLADAAANAAADAAAEAIDAANAATDAANLAAEAADAATVAAEEARDAADAATAAVEELATQVATLMAALKAQITTLANTVAKIAKKVRA